MASRKLHGERILFMQEGVFIHTTVARVDEDALVPGRVVLLDKPEGTFIEWQPQEEYDVKQGNIDEWAVVDAVGYKNDKSSPDTVAPVNQKQKRAEKHKYIINFDLKDLKSLKRSKPNLGWSYIIFILKCGTTYPALHFHQGGTKSLIKEMENHLIVKRSSTDSCLYLVREHDPQALSKSFDELQLFEEQGGDIITKFMKDPYSTTWGGFSKVTKFLHDTLVAPEGNTKLQDKEQVADILSEDMGGMSVNHEDEPGFEMVTKVEFPDRPKVKRKDPLSPQRWASYLDKEGRVINVQEVKDDIFRGGVDATLRIEVWKFLLGYYSWDSTYERRTEQRKKKVDDYFRMKLQWKSFSEDQERRFFLLKDKKSLIDKDVTRTDRTHHFFAGDGNPNIQMLYDILMTYCMYNFDLGYVQGMSDLLAPILVVMENEVDAFWCFAGFMDMVAHNFEVSQEGMKRQLADLQLIMRYMDPQFANYLEGQDSSNMYFCFRWLLIMFKREFSFPDCMRLWEVLWTGKPCKNYHMLICLAILDGEKNTLIENNFGFTEILKHINDISCTIDLDMTLKKAEGMFLQIQNCSPAPQQLLELFDMTVMCNGDMASVLPGGKNLVRNSNTMDKLDHECNTAVTTPDDNSIEILPEHAELHVF